jgi:glucosamine--fructose-6-phosphate aminotransferase (isomerizing)
MCGIVGYTGGQNAIIPVVEGLSRLEYRGYDSAGVSIRDKDHLTNIQKRRKLEL